MSDSNLYDDDILLWSEQQAAVIRRLRETGRAPNDLDAENLAEEVEGVGRSELAAVKSYLRLILAHLMKLSIEDESEAASHWQAEIMAFHSGLLDRYAPSMYARIDLTALWQSERKRMILDVGSERAEGLLALPTTCRVSLDDLIGEDIESPSLVVRLLAAAAKS